MEESFLGVPQQILTTESFAQAAMNAITGIGSLFSDEIEQTKTPMQTYQEELARLKQASQELETAMKNAAAAQKAGQTQVDVNINNAPPGSSVKTKSKGNAPPVNTSKGGKNP
jgi:hypothetical protein